MEFITIAHEENFLKLVKISGMDPSKIEEEIFLQGDDGELFGDDRDHAGKTILEVLEEDKKEEALPVFTFMVFSEYTTEMGQLLGDLVLLSTDLDCPQCGCDLERYSEKEFGKDYDVERCYNPSCDYESRTQVRIRDEWE